MQLGSPDGAELDHMVYAIMQDGVRRTEDVEAKYANHFAKHPADDPAVNDHYVLWYSAVSDGLSTILDTIDKHLTQFALGVLSYLAIVPFVILLVKFLESCKSVKGYKIIFFLLLLAAVLLSPFSYITFWIKKLNKLVRKAKKTMKEPKSMLPSRKAKKQEEQLPDAVVVTFE